MQNFIERKETGGVNKAGNKIKLRVFGTVSKLAVFIRKTFIPKKQSTSKLFVAYIGQWYILYIHANMLLVGKY